jgi:16S rRNA (adenine1518-N6/adenine1519-N6)-dimethyltransferase
MANSNHKTNNQHKYVHHQGHVAQKRFGQNFLHDEMCIHQIIEHIKYDYVGAHNVLMEIGPGLGALTKHLINIATAPLNVIEIDHQLSQRLRNNWSEDLLCIHMQDVLQFDFTLYQQSILQLQNKKIHLVGNLPYNISSPLLLYLLQHIHVISLQHFMLQKEVVERMVAEPHTKAYGRLSILLQAHYTMQKILDVPPYAFNPPPKVDSAVIRMQPCIRIQHQKIKQLEQITRMCFAQRRKMLRGFVMHKAIFEQLNFDLNRRAEEVSVDEYIQIAELWPTKIL